MQWLIPVATAAWAIWTWAHDRQKERQGERDRMAALYVIPFLSACEDLQSRIYNILERDGLKALRQRYPDGCHAEETLYTIVRYFGWLATVRRYGPYTQDPVLIRLTTATRRAFAACSDDRPVGPFNFFLPEQKALGKLVMERVFGEHGRELDTVSFYEFKEILHTPALAASSAVQQSLDALRNTEVAAELSGRERLIDVQNRLVDLLEYLESNEGFSVSPQKRQRCGHQVQAVKRATAAVRPLKKASAKLPA